MTSTAYVVNFLGPYCVLFGCINTRFKSILKAALIVDEGTCTAAGIIARHKSQMNNERTRRLSGRSSKIQ